MITIQKTGVNKTSYRPGGGETICPPADGSLTRGGRVRRPHVAKLQAASVPKA